jgi:hypothetical protein
MVAHGRGRLAGLAAGLVAGLVQLLGGEGAVQPLHLTGTDPDPPGVAQQLADLLGCECSRCVHPIRLRPRHRIPAPIPVNRLRLTANTR